MAQFVERMKEMTVDADRLKKQENSGDVRVDEISDYNTDDAVYIFPKEDNEDSVEMENVPDTYSEQISTEPSEMNSFVTFQQGGVGNNI